MKISKSALLAVLAMTFVLPVMSLAQIAEITVRVDGLSCPFCAYGLEKQLKTVEGTEDPVIDVKKGLVTLAPSYERTVDFTGLREAVTKAGFTPREIQASGTGYVATIQDLTHLLSQDGEMLFVLQTGDTLLEATDGKRAFQFAGTVLARAKDEPNTGPYTLALITPSQEEEHP